MPFRFLVVLTFLLVAAGLPVRAVADPLARPTPHAGVIVAAKGGEELLPVTQPSWLPAVVRQDLLTGDTLKTNTIGNLALLFADQTQIRVGRNSTLLVKQVAATGEAELSLPVGNVWARAARGGSGITIDTPAAAAAIRGTDWSLSVAGGKTSLIVMEGVVELTNPQGSVTVREGEAAVATIGQKPTKIVLVRPKDREQMLFYLSLRDAFATLPATPLESRAMRADRERILAKPDASRSAEDWLTLAEIALQFDGRAAAAAAVAQARRFRLTGRQRARADLVEALIAGSERRWDDAARLFRQAEPGLDPARRVAASYGRAFADGLADPSRAPALPTGRVAQGPVAALGQAWVAGFLQDPQAALEVIQKASRRYPKDTMLAAIEARLALLADRPDVADAAVARGEALDPDDPAIIQARAYVRALNRSELDEALADLTRAAELAPGDVDTWNGIGLIQNERDANREAEAAYQRAIALDPQDPTPRANYAIMLLDQSRVAEAKAQIDTTLALDPSFHFGYTALGRYYLQVGDNAKGLENLLAGSVANPAYSQGLLALAIGYYQNGDIDPALQQLDAAQRLDPNDPVVSIARTAIALDRFQADEAIINARAAMAKIQARGGYYTPLASARDAGSYLADSFRLLELNAWGRYYGDVVFDPFVATGYFDQALARRPTPFFDGTTFTGPELGEDFGSNSFSSLTQGLLIDPLAIAGRNRRIDLVRRPFLDTQIGGGLVYRNGELGWSGSAEVQGFSNLPVPTSFYLNLEGLDTSGDRRNDDFQALSGSAFIGSNPTPYDHVLGFAVATRTEPSLPWLPSPLIPQDDRESLSVLGGVGWGHVFGDRNMLMAAAVGSFGRDEQDRAFPQFGLEINQKTEQTTGLAGVTHLYGIGRATLRYGAEGSTTRATSEGFVTGSGDQRGEGTLDAGRFHADLTVPLGDRLQVEGGAQAVVIEGGSLDVSRVDPRIGASFEVARGQWLRAAYRRDTEFPIAFTLSPVATLGLLPAIAPLDTGGSAESAILRWDAEWGAHLFTSLEYQHQELDDLSLPIFGTVDSLDLDSGRIDRVTATANVWIGGGFGLFATGSLADSQATDATFSYDGDMPFLPDTFGRVGITWVSPYFVKLTLAQNFVGERVGVRQTLLGYIQADLKPYSTTDLTMSWEPLDRRFLVEASLLNAFDRDYEIAPGTDGPGRTVLGSLKVRF